MGIFNEQSFDHPFAKGIQGAPGVGFSLTADGNYDMNKKRLTNVGAPSANTDAATKKYVDDNSGGSPSTTRLTVDSNIDMKDQYRILNLKHPVDADEPATKQYSDSTFLDRNGSRTMIGNLSMNNNKIIKLGTPTVNDDAANKKYVDDKSSESVPSTRLTVDSNINMENTYRITNLKTPIDGKEPPTKDYVDNTFLDRDGSYPMKGNLNMGNNRIFNLPAPNGNNQPTPLAFTDLKYVARDGSSTMTNNLNMDNKKIINLRPPTSNTDAATKKYVDDNTDAQDLSDYLEKDGSVTMTGNFNVGNNKIINLSKPTQDNDAVNKDYADKLVNHTAVQPSHYNDQFAYLMSSGSQWTDEIDNTTSFVIKRIGDLAPTQGNFHDYNHKVIFMGINKNSQGGYKYKMGINFYRLTANTEYTLCMEILNTDYQLWHKSQISVDKETSTGLSIGNVSIRKLSHRYTKSNGQQQFMYYHRIIVNFRKLSTGNKFFLHILVNIPQDGTDLAVYPKQFSGVYIITYGIVGTFSNIDPDKVYDYHTAFDIKPTQVVYNVDINANNKKILNVNLDRNNNNSAATVGMVKEIKPHTINYLYRSYFEEVYDFTNAARYKLSRASSGIVFRYLSSSSGDTLRDVGIPLRTIDDIKKEGLNVSGYNISFSPSHGITKYTLCLIFYHWRNRNFSIKKKDSNNAATLLDFYYTTTGNTVNLVVNNLTSQLTMPSDFNGKKIVIWLAEDFSQNITKVKISNYSALLSLQSVRYTREQEFVFTTQDGILSKIMFSPNFYDVNSEQYHRVLLQEKLNGSYVL
ncbi:hypothetical protein ABFA07_003919 [Porites harrisoni]